MPKGKKPSSKAPKTKTTFAVHVEGTQLTDEQREKLRKSLRTFAKATLSRDFPAAAVKVSTTQDEWVNQPFGPGRDDDDDDKDRDKDREDA